MNQSLRRLVHYIFLYACIEGLVVNIFYPNPLAYLPKDVLIAFLYLGIMSDGRLRGGSVERFTGPFTVFAVVCLLFVAMPTQMTFLGISVALKQRLFYIPLIYAGYHYVRGDADTAVLLRIIAWSSIPVSIFGVYLFFAGPAGLSSIGADYAHVFRSTKGQAGLDFYRVPGTFTSPGQYAAYLYTVGTLLVGFLLVKQLRPRDRTMILLALACLLPALLTSGTRTPLLLFFVASGAVAVLSRQLSRVGIGAAVGYFAVVVGISYFGAGVGDRVSSIGTQDTLTRFNETFFGQLFLPQMFAHPLGVGLGAGTIGARHFAPEGAVQLVESYLGILTTEMGVIGLLSFLVLAVAIASYLLRSRPSMTHAAALPIWNAVFVQSLLTLGLTSNGTALDAIPMNLYFWFFLGVAAKLVDLERWRLGQSRSAPQPSATPGYGGTVAG